MQQPKSSQEILAQDFSPEFVDLMKEQVVKGFEEWGSICQYIQNKETTIYHVIKRVEEHLLGFAETGKETHLADAANIVMFLFMRHQIRPESIKRDHVVAAESK